MIILPLIPRSLKFWLLDVVLKLEKWVTYIKKPNWTFRNIYLISQNRFYYCFIDFTKKSILLQPLPFFKFIAFSAIDFTRNNLSIAFYFFQFRLVLKCRSRARKQFAALRSDVLVKLELLDNKHFQDMVFQLKRLLEGLAKFHVQTQQIVSQEKLFPIEVDWEPPSIDSTEDQIE